MNSKRRRLTGEQKAAILREHLVDKVPLSDLCDKHGIKPTLFYRWQKEAFENMPSSFDRRTDSEVNSLKNKIEALNEKLGHKDRVISEIMEDFIAAKKKVGDSR